MIANTDVAALFPGGKVTDHWYYSFRAQWSHKLGEKYKKKHEIQHELWTL